MLSRPASSVTPSPGFVQQRLQPVPLLVGQIARVHAPTLSTQHLSAYSFQGSFASFWTDSKMFDLCPPRFHMTSFSVRCSRNCAFNLSLCLKHTGVREADRVNPREHAVRPRPTPNKLSGHNIHRRHRRALSADFYRPDDPPTAPFGPGTSGTKPQRKLRYNSGRQRVCLESRPPPGEA